MSYLYIRIIEFEFNVSDLTAISIVKSLLFQNIISL